MGGRFDQSKLRMASSDIEISLVRVFVVVVRRGWACDEVNRCAARLYFLLRIARFLGIAHELHCANNIA